MNKFDLEKKFANFEEKNVIGLCKVSDLNRQLYQWKKYRNWQKDFKYLIKL